MPAKKKGEAFDAELRVRMRSTELDKFIKKSERVTKKPYQVFIREMVDAFNKGKLRIIEKDLEMSDSLYITE